MTVSAEVAAAPTAAPVVEAPAVVEPAVVEAAPVEAAPAEETPAPAAEETTTPVKPAVKRSPFSDLKNKIFKSPVSVYPPSLLLCARSSPPTCAALEPPLGTAISPHSAPKRVTSHSLARLMGLTGLF